MKKNNNKLNYHRVHPYAIFITIRRFLFLFILPVVQQILFRPMNIFETISSMGLNILFVIMLFAFAISEYKDSMYHISEKFVSIKKGHYIKKEMDIPKDKLQMISIEKSITSKIFGASKVYIDTPGGSSKKVDIQITISNKKIDNFLSKIIPQNRLTRAYQCGSFRMLLMTASWANPVAGLLLLSPFIKEVGEILGEEFNELFYNTLNITYRLVTIGISPVTATVANILIIGWAFAMIVQTFRYGNFRVYKHNDMIMIKRGFIIKNTRIIFKNRITALTIRQTMIMKIFKLYSAYVKTIGSGKEKSDKSLLVACAKKKQMQSALDGLIYINSQSKNEIRPPKKRLFSYICIPIFLSIGVIGSLIILYIKNISRELTVLILLMTLIWSIWWIIFRIFAFKSSFLSCNDDVVIIGTFERFTLNINYIPYEKLQYIEVKQNPFQRNSKCCDVYFWLYSDRKEHIKIKYLDKMQANKLIHIIKQNINKKDI